MEAKTMTEYISEAKKVTDWKLVEWIDLQRNMLYNELFQEDKVKLNEIEVNLIFLQISYLEGLLRKPEEIQKFSNFNE